MSCRVVGQFEFRLPTEAVRKRGLSSVGEVDVGFECEPKETLNIVGR